jgi:hypothetical protein
VDERHEPKDRMKGSINWIFFSVFFVIMNDIVPSFIASDSIPFPTSLSDKLRFIPFAINPAAIMDTYHSLIQKNSALFEIGQSVCFNFFFQNEQHTFTALFGKVMTNAIP